MKVTCSGCNGTGKQPHPAALGSEGGMVECLECNGTGEFGDNLSLIFIINGVDVPVIANEMESLEVARDVALEHSGNIGRPFSDWVIRDEKGVTLPPEQRIERFGFENDVRMFLMPAVGAGGTQP